MKQVNLALTKEEIGILINAINDFRNDKIKEEINTEPLDELLIKLVDVYEAKFPIIKRRDYER
ncbi:MAG: hypothetical protein PUD34_01860 [bacterium]|nr:hypothetical protein [bacterium]